MKRIIFFGLFLLILSDTSFAETNTAKRSLVLVNPSLKEMLCYQEYGYMFADLEGKGFAGYASEEPDDFFQMPGEFEEKREGLKSGAKAALLSLLLPGAGEIYGGSVGKGKVFMFSEAALWIGFFGFRTYGDWLRKDYKVYAASHAKVNLEGKSDDYFDQLAFYDSRDQYNQYAPLYYREDRQPYPEDEFWNWEWDSRRSRDYYRDLKNRSKNASRNALYMVGLSVLNRIVSVVDVMKTVRTYNRKKSLEFSHMKFDLKANLLAQNPTVMLYITRRW